ncbi:DUF2180 family protein [Streptomyces tsukubensis]|uniref:DUF2180 family protein n=1 Tax=Streptomyces tsukubensis TaxID=83656 RepID=A0A1V4A5D3_9ACTN|nr:DUF2180 family protein [Streptomyces tsukubensis]OON75381.1 hypothetical protein B1H18_23150 [Streptomyces tsukubensis]QFR94989.1 DUF2180 family protein [Streptomyces tsukubensis]
MLCYECALDDRRQASAAVCTRCGIAVCTEHSAVTTVRPRRAIGLGTTTLGSPARLATCTTCR